MIKNDFNRFKPLLQKDDLDLLLAATYSGTAGIGGGIGGGDGTDFIFCSACNTAIPFWNSSESNLLRHMCVATSFATI